MSADLLDLYAKGHTDGYHAGYGRGREFALRHNVAARNATQEWQRMDPTLSEAIRRRMPQLGAALDRLDAVQEEDR